MKKMQTVSHRKTIGKGGRTVGATSTPRVRKERATSSRPLSRIAASTNTSGTRKASVSTRGGCSSCSRNKNK